MNNYIELLNQLLKNANGLIDQASSVNDKFDMSIRLAEQVINAIKVSNVDLSPVVNVQKEEVVQAVKEVEKVLTKKQYEKLLGYKISKEAYQEYLDYQDRMAKGETFNFWIPDEDGLMPVPEGAIVTLAVKENPALQKVEEEQEEIVVDDTPLEQVIEEEVVEEEEQELTIEQAVEQALSEPDGVEIDIDADPAAEEEELDFSAVVGGETIDVSEQYNIIKGLNANLTHEELKERAVDWIEFSINKETYDLLNFIEDEDSELIQAKSYLAYYIDAMEMDGIVYYINYFAANIEEDEEGNEVYVNEELQLEFLNKDNINAFLEYVQQF
jgi:hypothetical protein